MAIAYLASDNIAYLASDNITESFSIYALNLLYP